MVLQLSPAYRGKFERMAESLFPESYQNCHAFMRHKDILLSPSLLRTCGIEYMQVGGGRRVDIQGGVMWPCLLTPPSALVYGAGVRCLKDPPCLSDVEQCDVVCYAAYWVSESSSALCSS